MDLEIVILTEVRHTSKGEILYDIPYMWNLKIHATDELIYRAETDSQT